MLTLHPRKHSTHASTPSTPAYHPHKHATHVSTPRTPPTLAGYPRKHTTYASTPPTQARHHVIHASTNSMPFLKLNIYYETVFFHYILYIFNLLKLFLKRKKEVNQLM